MLTAIRQTMTCISAMQLIIDRAVTLNSTTNSFILPLQKRDALRETWTNYAIKKTWTNYAKKLWSLLITKW